MQQTLPKGWKMVKLGEVADVTSSKRIFEAEYVSNGIPFYRTKEIVELSQGHPITLELFIAEKKYKEIKARFDVPRKGDILLSAVGTIGVSWIISDDREFYFKDGNLLWLKQFKNIAAIFLKHVLDQIFGLRLNEYIFGAAYKALTIVKLKQMPIPLPPLPLQQEFASLVEDIEAEKARQAEGRKKLDELFNSLMQRAFTGELVA